MEREGEIVPSHRTLIEERSVAGIFLLHNGILNVRASAADCKVYGGV